MDTVLSIYERTFLVNQIIQKIRLTIGINNIHDVVRDAIISAGIGDLDDKINGVMTLYNPKGYESCDNLTYIHNLRNLIFNTCTSLVQTYAGNIANVCMNEIVGLPPSINYVALNKIILSEEVISRLCMIVPNTTSIEIVC